MTPVQLKMARAAIGLTPEDLAARTGVSAAAIASFESGVGGDDGFAERVKGVFDEAGIVWIGDDGVRFTGAAAGATIPLGDLNSANDE